MGNIRVRWTLNGKAGSSLFPADSPWDDVRNFINANSFGYGKKPGTTRIHVRPRFHALVDRLFADVFGMSRSPILPVRSFCWVTMRLITEELLLVMLLQS